MDMGHVDELLEAVFSGRTGIPEALEACSNTEERQVLSELLSEMTEQADDGE